MTIKSPCVDLCQFDGKVGFCTGYLRRLTKARERKKIGDHGRY